MMALSDSTFTYFTASSSYTSPGLIDTGWVAAYLGIALAAFSSQPRSEVVARAERTRPALASLVAPLVPVLLALAVTAVQIRLGHHLDHAAWLMAFTLVALVLVRQGLIMLELFGPGHNTQGGPRQRVTQAALRGAPDQAPGHRAGSYDPV
jgi:hypothetical protein